MSLTCSSKGTDHPFWQRIFAGHSLPLQINICFGVEIYTYCFTLVLCNTIFACLSFSFSYNCVPRMKRGSADVNWRAAMQLSFLGGLAPVSWLLLMFLTWAFCKCCRIISCQGVSCAGQTRVTCLACLTTSISLYENRPESDCSREFDTYLQKMLHPLSILL